jgi:hypothetical protein
MSKPQPIVLNNFQKEMAPSAYLGYQEIRNLNATDEPGVIYPGNIFTKLSGTSVTGRIKWLKADGSEFWAIDASGAVYDITAPLGVWAFTKRTGITAGTGQGLELWKNYAFIFNNISVEVVSTATHTVTTTWDGSAIDNPNGGDHPSIVGNDDILYAGAGKYVYMLEQVAGKTFDPTDATTFIFTKRALELPDGYIITCFAELGTWMAIGTRKSNDGDIADIFLWDRAKTDAESAIKISGRGIVQMASINNLLYARTGDEKWFVTNGSSVEPFAELPRTMFGADAYPLFLGDYGAIAVFKNKIYFGVSSETAYIAHGVYSLDVKTGGFALAHTLSNNAVNDNDSKRIGALIVKDGSLFTAWAIDATTDTFGVDKDFATPHTGDLAFFISQIYRVAGRLNKRTFTSVDIQLARPIVANDSVKLYYRTNMLSNATYPTGNWTLIGTLDTVGETSKSIPVGFSAESIQFKVVLNKTAKLFDITIN